MAPVRSDGVRRIDGETIRAAARRPAPQSFRWRIPRSEGRAAGRQGESGDHRRIDDGAARDR